MTGIQWTSRTWNPSTGCDRVSPGCDNCYAMTMAKRLKGMGSAKYQRDGDPRTSGPGFGITEHPDTLTAPLRWRKPAKVFVDSMSDLLHDGVSDEFIAQVWAVMAATPQHIYQVLTKRHGRLRSVLNQPQFAAAVAREMSESLDLHPDYLDSITGRVPRWPLDNVWLGVSVEDQKRADLRIPALLGTPAAVRFLSCEPLIGPVDLGQWLGMPESTGLRWVIVGGESGAGARPLDVEWVRSIVKQCRASGVACFVKQMGSVWAGGGKGGDPDAWPEDLRIREFPAGAR